MPSVGIHFSNVKESLITPINPLRIVSKDKHPTDGLESGLGPPSRYIANNPCPPPLEGLKPTPVIEDDESKKFRYRLLNQAAKLCLHHRVSHCCRTMQNRDKSITIQKRFDVADEATARFSFAGLQTCGSVHICPHCAPYIASIREKEVEQCITSWQDKKVRVVFLTLTHPHTDDMILDYQLKRLLGHGEKKRGGAIARFTMSKAWRRLNKAGYIRRIEVTRGEYNGWHPHTHWLIGINPESNGDYEFDGAELAFAWRRACLNADLPLPSIDRGFCFEDVGDDAKALGKYVAKMGTWTLASEMTKGHLKKGKSKSRSPWQILADSESCSKSADLFVDYADSMKGVRALIWSRGLKKDSGLLDVTDQDIAGERATVEELIYTFNTEHDYIDDYGSHEITGRDKFHLVLGRGSRFECLRQARLGGSQAVHDYVWSLIIGYRDGYFQFDEREPRKRPIPFLQPVNIRLDS